MLRHDPNTDQTLTRPSSRLHLLRRSRSIFHRPPTPQHPPLTNRAFALTQNNRHPKSAAPGPLARLTANSHHKRRRRLRHTRRRNRHPRDLPRRTFVRLPGRICQPTRQRQLQIPARDSLRSRLDGVQRPLQQDSRYMLCILGARIFRRESPSLYPLIPLLP